MADNTKIEWARHPVTGKGATWNPITGKVRFNEKWLDQPLHWRAPRGIFVCAHGDLFHENVPDEWIDRVFAIMALCPQHVFFVLTKRPERMREYLARDGEAHVRVLDHSMESISHPNVDPDRLFISDGPEGQTCEFTRWPLPNVWLGTSIEDQATADTRILCLLETPAARRFVSAEPLLGPVDLRRWLHDWGCERCGYGGDQHDDACASCGWTGHAGPDDPPLYCPECGQELDDELACPECHATNDDGFGPTISGQRLGLIDWVISGGESGPHARPSHPDWHRALRDQCAEARVPFLFKQWGEYHPATDHDPDNCTETPVAIHISGRREYRSAEQFALVAEQAEGWSGMCRIGKSAAGRLLDGQTHDAMPGVVE